MGLPKIAQLSMNAGRGKCDCRISLSALFLAGFCNPRPDRLAGRLKLTNEIVRVAASKNQINHLATELR